jgi:microfibrillar-associated protein 1
MQVKNFGMAGRTKYTHLVDQDTTLREKSPWTSDKQSTLKFHREHGGGMKEVFERPKLKSTSKKTR